jgi:sugar lactone lactonase YvrE
LLIVVVGLAFGATREAAAQSRDSTATGSAPAAGDSVTWQPRGPDSVASAPDSLPLGLGEIATIAQPGSGRGEVIEPSGVMADAFGRVYVVDAGLHRFQRFDRDGRWLGEAGSLGSDAGQMRRPGAIVPLGALSVAVLDVENRRVLSYDLFGRLQGVALDLATPALENEVGRPDPIGLASDRGGALYVVDADRDRILVFDFSGRYLRTLGGIGTRPGSFRGLRSMAVGPRGELVTIERVNGRIQRLDAAGRPLAAWPLPMPPGRGGLAVAVDDSGRVAAADETLGRVWIFDPKGERRAQLDGLGRPRALAFAPDGTLLVAETTPARVRRFGFVPRRARSPE